MIGLRDDGQIDRLGELQRLVAVVEDMRGRHGQTVGHRPVIHPALAFPQPQFIVRWKDEQTQLADHNLQPLIIEFLPDVLAAGRPHEVGIAIGFLNGAEPVWSHNIH